eukprot:TRINITY_DN14595_c0_g1_i1.p1 TRINITY_DN14595_c0_g1~~TRINITY_DN14595_c0_g1_i1.p1  ORF type:complete len:470 (+),score=84.36 TRINITY_DN14595_c0_g1_i1:34-1410(+)
MLSAIFLSVTLAIFQLEIASADLLNSYTHASVVKCVALNALNSIEMVAGTQAGTLLWWNGTASRAFTGFMGVVSAISWRPGTAAFAATTGNGFFVWNSQVPGSPLYQLNTLGNPFVIANFMAYKSDGTRVVTIDTNGVGYQFNSTGVRVVAEDIIGGAIPTAASYDTSNTKLLVAFGNVVKEYTAATGAQTKTYTDSTNVQALCARNSLDFLTLVPAANAVRVWRIGNATTFQSYFTVGAGATQLACHPTDERTVLVGSSNGLIEWWDRNGTKLRIFSNHTLGITALVWHSNGIEFASGSQDLTMKRWNTSAPLVPPPPPTPVTPGPVPVPVPVPAPLPATQTPATRPAPNSAPTPPANKGRLLIIVLAVGGAVVLAAISGLVFKLCAGGCRFGATGLVRKQDQVLVERAHEADKAAAVQAARQEEGERMNTEEGEEEEVTFGEEMQEEEEEEEEDDE